MMNNWIVRIVRKYWFQTDYVGTFPALTAVQALTIAGNTPYYRKIAKGRIVRVEAEIDSKIN